MIQFPALPAAVLSTKKYFGLWFVPKEPPARRAAKRGSKTAQTLRRPADGWGGCGFRRRALARPASGGKNKNPAGRASGVLRLIRACLLHYEFNFYQLSVVVARQGGYVEAGRQGLGEVDLKTFGR
ncbi:MAG: hypothetical protein AVDCRST_MAG95-1488 [uncultured Adhaeribacter sp.]|uniref:Uncharacterized protein n=1 Tax=uncultured Adhaeribacter sp. TaxID=448109 RepID=A0A6J4I7K5_9BACT|nr:MAG: hypothetical protein AVDCRST_MAG95-1488 [uncultured Adhaeribacter sp.]